MNEPSRNKLGSILALATALIATGFLPHSAHGMYDPKHGRWLQRDPIGVRPSPTGRIAPPQQLADGNNVHEYVHSCPTRYDDPNGLAAWKHTSWWDDSWRERYSQYVAQHAKDYLGRMEDCADLTMLVLIDFASANGLPLTFWHGSGCIYVSKSCNFSSQEEFKKTVFKKTGAADLYGASGKTSNTGPDKDISAVIAGDVYTEPSHAALVVHVAPDGQLSGGQQWYSSTDGKRYADAKPGIWTWNDHSPDENPDHLEWIYDPKSTQGYRVDYLNHTGSEKRQKAELKYNRLSTSFTGKFRSWHPGVFSNYKNWDGRTNLADECKK